MDIYADAGKVLKRIDQLRELIISKMNSDLEQIKSDTPILKTVYESLCANVMGADYNDLQFLNDYYNKPPHNGKQKNMVYRIAYNVIMEKQVAELNGEHFDIHDATTDEYLTFLDLVGKEYGYEIVCK